MTKFITLALSALVSGLLLAQEKPSGDITRPYGLEVGHSTLQQAEQTVEDGHDTFDVIEDPAQLYYRAITLDIPGWQKHQRSLGRFADDGIYSDTVFLDLLVDEQGIIQSLNISFTLETNQEARALYEKIDQALQQKATPDKQFRLAEENYQHNFIIDDQSDDFLYPSYAEITQAVVVYRHEHTNFLLYQGYGDDLSEIPQQITLKDYGDMQRYAEFATRPKLAWVSDQPSWYVMLIISSDTYQQLFDDLLAKYATSGDLIDAEKVMLDEALGK
ncbi:hypothetical protein L0B52_04560 [Suttonella sp. R2A3]|uniref:hypothetical protein n=1 Tax=Suttonella sp. R2A3 TaxID=2908648 RepID=UPI001F2733DD|nr:hypothetical protein [Suttonella sp. R2A3]UJF25422.1 hypothetical protein L0B52_04560 [Suttonella sp. R2A3]